MPLLNLVKSLTSKGFLVSLEITGEEFVDHELYGLSKLKKPCKFTFLNYIFSSEKHIRNLTCIQLNLMMQATFIHDSLSFRLTDPLSF